MFDFPTAVDGTRNFLGTGLNGPLALLVAIAFCIFIGSGLRGGGGGSGHHHNH